MAFDTTRVSVRETCGMEGRLAVDRMVLTTVRLAGGYGRVVDGYRDSDTT